MSCVRVLELRERDTEPYRALMLRAYADAPDAFTATPQERAAKPASWWAKRLDDAQGLATTLGAFDDTGLVGAVTVEFSERPKTRHKGHVIGMYVVPHARKVGVGRALLERAIACSRERGDITVLTLTFTQGNDGAIGLYRKLGFVEFGVEPMAMRMDERYFAKVHMWCRIDDNR